MLGYLASQMATVPHAHGRCGENQPSDHNARHHVHVSWFEHDDHSHDGGHSHHHECDEGNSQPPLSESNAEHDGHDSDAVYLPNDTGVSLASNSVVSLGSFQVVSTLAIAAVPTPTVFSESLAAAYSSDNCSSGCPLYLALRALRI
jgi:hypothetical protein